VLLIPTAAATRSTMRGVTIDMTDERTDIFSLL
jgi:hypothetical protein